MQPDGYIIFQSLAVSSNLPSSMRMPNLVQKFVKYKIGSIQKIAQRLIKFCKSSEILAKSGHTGRIFGEKNPVLTRQGDTFA